MDTVTYPNAQVARFLTEQVIPVRLSFDAVPEATDFKVKWTPSLIIVDSDGEEHHRTTGFLEPIELMAMILLGIGKTHFDRERFKEAINVLDRLLKDFGKTDSAPEAMYYGGVSRYKDTKNPAPLKEAYERLNREHPTSEWTKRAAPYRLL
jgi:tetratricopeptide (TPR) repeat protein